MPEPTASRTASKQLKAGRLSVSGAKRVMRESRSVVSSSREGRPVVGFDIDDDAICGTV